MFRHGLFGSIALMLLAPVMVAGEDPVFSGPQVGEALAPFKATGALGSVAGKEFDLVAMADGKPIALIFVHGKTRPAFGLSNAMMQYVATRAKDGLVGGVVYLTDDPTEEKRWMAGNPRYFPEGVVYGVSTDGIEGPGSYGLNRNVSLTVLVAKEGKVTANFALVQPSLQADGPKILKAIVDAVGSGEVPDVASLGGGMRRQAATRPAMRDNEKMRKESDVRGQQNDPQLTSLLRSVINKQASDEAVTAAAGKVEEYVAEHEEARNQLGRITSTVVNSGRLSNYGTEAAQNILRGWATKYGPAKEK